MSSTVLLSPVPRAHGSGYRDGVRDALQVQLSWSQPVPEHPHMDGGWCWDKRRHRAPSGMVWGVNTALLLRALQN